MSSDLSADDFDSFYSIISVGEKIEIVPENRLDALLGAIVGMICGKNAPGY
jgi:hypothetical protein